MRRAKIVATIGPSTSSISILESLIKSGVDVCRLNFSHNTFEEHKKLLLRIRNAAKNVKRQPAIMQDLPGPKARVMGIKKPFLLSEDSVVAIRFGKSKSHTNSFSINYPSLLRALKIGDPILIDDGLIRLKVIKTNADAIHCKVGIGGILKSNKGVNLPNSNWETPPLTPADKKALIFGIKNGIDFIALSFVANKKSILAAKRIINKHKSHTKIIAKIERPVAVNNLDEILDCTDGVMVARGDLGIETSIEKVPFLQKDIIKRANKKNVTVITATQMLESMTNNALPTRAETSDIANAVLDGTDALMLSAETAVGNYPVEAVKMMNRIIIESEHQSMQSLTYNSSYTHADTCNLREVICYAAMVSTNNLKNDKIVLFSVSGKTARLLSKLRPSADIFAFTPSRKTMVQLNLEWGIHSLFMDYRDSSEEMIRDATTQLKQNNLLERSDCLLFIIDGSDKKHQNYSLIVKHPV